MDIIVAILVFILGLFIWALFCLLPAASLYNDYSESVGIAYFFLSTLLFMMSYTLNGIRSAVEAGNAEIRRGIIDQKG